jgi:enterochelin esterase-like enzyme
VLDEYAGWIVDTVIPRARREANIKSGAQHVYLDGCSLGGYVGIEVFVRKHQHFGAWGSVQGALGDHRIHGYAERFAEIVAHEKKHFHVETSSGDTFRRVNEQFSKLLRDKGVKHDFVMPPGPHNQPFLRDSGTIEMLLWYDRLPR